MPPSSSDGWIDRWECEREEPAFVSWWEGPVSRKRRRRRTKRTTLGNYQRRTGPTILACITDRVSDTRTRIVTPSLPPSLSLFYSLLCWRHSISEPKEKDEKYYESRNDFGLRFSVFSLLFFPQRRRRNRSDERKEDKAKTSFSFTQIRHMHVLEMKS